MQVRNGKRHFVYPCAKPGQGPARDGMDPAERSILTPLPCIVVSRAGH